MAESQRKKERTEIAQRLRAFRERTGKNQVEMAKSLEILTRTYRTYEEAINWPSVQVLKKLAGAGLNIHWLVTGDGTMFFKPGQMPLDPPLLEKILEIVSGKNLPPKSIFTIILTFHEIQAKSGSLEHVTIETLIENLFPSEKR